MSTVCLLLPLYSLSSLHFVPRVLDRYQYQIATSSVGRRQDHREPNALWPLLQAHASLDRGERVWGVREKRWKGAKRKEGKWECPRREGGKLKEGRDREPDRQLHGSSVCSTSSKNSTLNRDGNNPRLSWDPARNHLEATAKLILKELQAF